MSDIIVTNTLAQENLKQLEDVFIANTSLLLKSTVATEGLFKSFASNAINEVPIEDGDKMYENLTNLNGRLSKAIDVMKERRMPLTRKLDALVKKFTMIEAGIDPLLEKVISFQKLWQLEKLRRAEEQAKIANERTKKEMAEVAIKKEEEQRLFTLFQVAIDAQLERMIDKFNNCTLETVDGYCEKLAAWEPYFDARVVENRGNINQWSDNWVKTMKQERDRLLSMQAQRKEELRLMKDDPDFAGVSKSRLEYEKDKRIEESLKRQQLALDKLEEQQRAEQTKLMLAAETEAKPELSKGASVKKKYEIDGIAGWLKIILWFCDSEINQLTDKQLESRFGFMLTAANRKLNAGEEISSIHLKIVQDVAIRKVSES